LLADFVATLEQLAGKKPELIDKPMLDADVGYTYADISKAQRLLGYAPSVGVVEGTRRFFDWYVREAAKK
jgi:UDP-glucuronate 4-epimerase